MWKPVPYRPPDFGDGQAPPRLENKRASATLLKTAVIQEVAKEMERRDPSARNLTKDRMER
jgi:hypothetical protein